MRQRTVNNLADTIFWYLLYFLPVLAYLLYTLAEGTSNSVISLSAFFTEIGLGIFTDNIIYTSISSIFGSSGVFPLFTNDTLICILTWFVSVFICHLLIDFILFIPRICHKWLKKATQGD